MALTCAAETASDPQSSPASPSVDRARARWAAAAFASAASSRSTALAKPGFFADVPPDDDGAGVPPDDDGAGVPPVFGSVGSVVRSAAAWARC